MIEVVVIEDSYYIRGFIKEELERHSDIRVVGRQRAGSQASTSSSHSGPR